MKLYSDFATRRTYEIVGDLVAVLVLVGGIVLAASLHGAISALTAIGRNIQQSGDDFSAAMSDISDNLAGIPLIGGGIRAPFDAAQGAGGTLAGAGERWQSGVEALANLVGWTVAILVVLIVLLGWVRPRLVRAARRGAVASLASSSPPSLDLLAFRALATRPARDVARLGPDAMAAWRRGDPEAIRRLAALELKASGIRMKEGASAR